MFVRALFANLAISTLRKGRDEARGGARPEDVVRFGGVVLFVTGLGGGMAQWNRHLDRCGAMGFSHVLMAPPFRPGRAGNILLTADFDALNPIFGAGEGLAVLRAIADSCHHRGIELWLDLVLDRVAGFLTKVRP